MKEQGKLRREYNRPRLEKYGPLHDLTRTSMNNGKPDNPQQSQDANTT